MNENPLQEIVSTLRLLNTSIDDLKIKLDIIDAEIQSIHKRINTVADAFSPRQSVFNRFTSWLISRPPST